MYLFQDFVNVDVVGFSPLSPPTVLLASSHGCSSGTFHFGGLLFSSNHAPAGCFRHVGGGGKGCGKQNGRAS